MTEKRSCNLPGCTVTGGLVRGLCTKNDESPGGHWVTHQGLADPEPAPKPDEDAPVLNEVGGTPIPAADEKKKG